MRKVWPILIAIILTITVIPIIIDIVPPAEAPTIYVDDDNTGPEDGSQANPWNTIQEAVDAAQPGDTVFVSNGTYYEDVYIDKTINLTGISRDNTTINASNIGIFVENADYVNITGFPIENGSSAGIRLMPSNDSLISNNRVERNNYGIQTFYSNHTTIKDNIASNNSDYYGIYIFQSTNITVNNNYCRNNNAAGIWIQSSFDSIINGNNCSYNSHGIYLSTGNYNNQIFDNFVSYNNGVGTTESGIFIGSSENNMFFNNTSLNDKYGLTMAYGPTFLNKIVNSTILLSTEYDILVRLGSQGSILNTTFNKTKVKFLDTTASLTVQWYLHVKVIDYLSNPVVNAKVRIEDNSNGSFNKTLFTDLSGYVRWVAITEYFEQDTTGDNFGEKTLFTPHRIIAWNDTLVGYARPPMNESKIVIVILNNGTLIDLKSGWNLISLPRVQSDTNLKIVLQSIEGRYDAVQWYNITDTNDHWKHFHILKPSNLNDLKKINHTMGFWLHITDPQGTTLVVIGDKLIANHSIIINPGWNLVGYPSLIIRTRDAALNNINFSTEVDSIWTYNATTQTWKEIEITDSIELGKGYWMHSKVTKVWDVPL